MPVFIFIITKSSVCVSLWLSLYYTNGEKARFFRAEEEKLWHAVVDYVTVYNDDRLVYSQKDGSEITVML